VTAMVVAAIRDIKSSSWVPPAHFPSTAIKPTNFYGFGLSWRHGITTDHAMFFPMTRVKSIINGLGGFRSPP
jgi:hypothetical protein